jgi:hypothetical protein
MGEDFHDMESVPVINMYDEMKIYFEPWTPSTSDSFFWMCREVLITNAALLFSSAYDWHCWPWFLANILPYLLQDVDLLNGIHL